MCALKRVEGSPQNPPFFAKKKFFPQDFLFPFIPVFLRENEGSEDRGACESQFY